MPYPNLSPEEHERLREIYFPRRSSAERFSDAVLTAWLLERKGYREMTNRMKDKNYGITYPVPVCLQLDWFWNLWARFMCPHGWHLLDEYQSLENHGLLCDACEMDVPLEGGPE